MISALRFVNPSKYFYDYTQKQSAAPRKHQVILWAWCLFLKPTLGMVFKTQFILKKKKKTAWTTAVQL